MTQQDEKEAAATNESAAELMAKAKVGDRVELERHVFGWCGYMMCVTVCNVLVFVCCLQVPSAIKDPSRFEVFGFGDKRNRLQFESLFVHSSIHRKKCLESNWTNSTLRLMMEKGTLRRVRAMDTPRSRVQETLKR